MGLEQGNEWRLCSASAVKLPDLVTTGSKCSRHIMER